MNKKTLWIILGITSNAIFLIGLLLIILSFKYDTQKEYAYTETTSINIQKDDKITASERPLDDSQEHDNRVNKVQVKKEVVTNDNNNYQVETSKKDYQNTTNKVINKVINDNKNDVDNSNNSNINNSNTNNSNSNKNDTNNSNNNYTVEYTNTSYCGFCGKKLNNNDGICEDCRDIRSKLGE